MFTSFTPTFTFCEQFNKRAAAEIKRWSLNSEGYILNIPNESTGTTGKKKASELYVTFSAPSDSLFTGETFTLRIRFTTKYPFEPPEVQFLVNDVTKAPEHPHVYTNGHVCLSILTPSAWSPALTVESTVLSIASLLSSCTERGVPEGNDSYVARVGTRTPLLTRWAFHDDTV
jgi:ubiquitin-conjugating enzyme E2 W